MTQSPGDEFYFWLEAHFLRNDGCWPRKDVAAKVNQLIEEAKAPLLKLLKGREYGN